MGTTLMMPRNDGTHNLIEGHPIGIRKIIQGDLRTHTWVAEGITHTAQNTDGTLLYDSQENRHRPYAVSHG